jgi:hypothetical protein
VTRSTTEVEARTCISARAHDRARYRSLPPPVHMGVISLRATMVRTRVCKVHHKFTRSRRSSFPRFALELWSKTRIPGLLSGLLAYPNVHHSALRPSGFSGVGDSSYVLKPLDPAHCSIGRSSRQQGSSQLCRTTSGVNPIATKQSHEMAHIHCMCHRGSFSFIQ